MIMSIKNSEKKIKNSLDDVLKRLKESESWRFDTDAANALGMDRRSLAGFKKRDTLPFDYLVKFATDNGYSLEWVINGRGPVKAESLVSDNESTYGTIDYPLFNRVGKVVHEFIENAGIEIATDSDKEKLDYLLAYCYDQVKKEGGDINQNNIASLVKLAM